jgi:hypothetical protein
MDSISTPHWMLSVLSLQKTIYIQCNEGNPTIENAKWTISPASPITGRLWRVLKSQWTRSTSDTPENFWKLVLFISDCVWNFFSLRKQKLTFLDIFEENAIFNFFEGLNFIEIIEYNANEFESNSYLIEWM